MRATLKGLIEFIDDDNVSGTVPASIKPIADKIGDVRTRVLAFKILCWLREQHRNGSYAPLPVNPKHTWVINLKDILNSFPTILNGLRIENDTVVLEPHISAEEWLQFANLVDSLYHPTIMRG